MTTPIKLGAEFLVNTATDGSQQESQVTALSDGRFLVIWRDPFIEPGIFRENIRAQFINADGTKSGSEFRVSSDIASIGGKAVELEDGRIAVVWQQSDGSNLGLVGRILNPDGTFASEVFPVNTTTAGLQGAHSLVALGTGGFAVVWNNFEENFSTDQVMTRRFNADGSPASAEVFFERVPDFIPVAVGSLPDGGFMTVQFGQFSDAKIFSDTGGQRSVFLSRSEIGRSDIDIAALADGRIAMVSTARVFSLTAPDNIRTAIEILDPTGSAAQPPILLEDGHLKGQRVIAALKDGGFIVVAANSATTGSDTNGSRIVAQVFNSDGSFAGAPRVINSTTTGSQSSPAVSVLADGRVIVTWTDPSASSFGGDTSGTAIRAQIIDVRTAAVSLNGTLADDQYHGTGFADVMAGSIGNDALLGAAGDDRLDGEWGDDLLQGGKGSDRLAGGDGNDDLRGGLGSDVLDGGAGDDTLNGGAGNDLMIGGAGNDTFIIDTIGDIVMEDVDGGIDTVTSANLSLSLAQYSNVENATVTGTAALNLIGNVASNVLVGNSAGNFMEGGDGHDRLQGLGGHDILDGGLGDDVLEGGGGNDTLFGGDGQDTIHGRNGTDTALGGEGDDILNGNDGNDTLEGGADNDTLDGDAGADILNGGTGDDVLTGGEGFDQFIFASDHQTARITDFEDGKDKINLAAYGFASALAAKAFAVQDGAGVVFTFAPGNVLTVDNMTLAQFTGADFILA